MKYDKLEGLYEEWWDNGNKSVKCYYKNDKLDGFYEVWWENENKCKEC